MKSEGKNIALLELGGSHDECLLSQMHALKKEGYSLSLICTPDIKERNPAFDEYISEYHVVEFKGSKWSEIQLMKRIWKYIKAKGFSKVILNTAQGSRIRNLCFMARRHPVEFIGIIHTARKFQGSFTQKMINKKVRKYLMLAEFLMDKIDIPEGVKVDYFYPLRFAKSNPTEAKGTQTEIAIIGGVENRRKDLDGFLKMCESIAELDLKFVFLGKSDANHEDVIAFKKAVNEKGLSDKIELFDSFISQVEFSRRIQNADLILPLVHPETPSADQYFRNQISGAMNISFGYTIPMLIHEHYQSIKEMNDASFYYSLENFREVLTKAIDHLEEKKASMKSNAAYDVEAQEKRYSDFVFASK